MELPVLYILLYAPYAGTNSCQYINKNLGKKGLVTFILYYAQWTSNNIGTTDRSHTVFWRYFKM